MRRDLQGLQEQLCPWQPGASTGETTRKPRAVSNDLTLPARVLYMGNTINNQVLRGSYGDNLC